MPIEEKVEMKSSSLPKQQIEILQIQKPVEDPSNYEKIDSLYDLLLEHEKTKDTLWCPDFMPLLQEWHINEKVEHDDFYKNRSNLSNEEDIIFNIPEF